jgi:hypothetical protein
MMNVQDRAKVDRLLRERITCACWGRANAVLGIILLAVSVATFPGREAFSLCCLLACYVLILRVVQYDRRFQRALRKFSN